MKNKAVYCLLIVLFVIFVIGISTNTYTKNKKEEYLVEFSEEELQWINNNQNKTFYIEVEDVQDESFFFNTNSENKKEGVLIDVLNNIEEDLGIRFEFILKDSTDINELEFMGNNKIFFGFTEDKFRNKPVIFSKTVYADAYNCYTLNPKIKSISELDGKKIGVKNYETVNNISKKYPNIKFITYYSDDYYQLQNLLINKRIDAIISEKDINLVYMDINKNFSLPNIKMERKFVFDNKATILKGIIDKKIDEMEINGLIDESVMKNKKKYANTLIRLTNAEIKWLQEHPVIKFIALYDYPPFDIIDEKNNYTGINAEYLKRIEEALGIKFELVKNASKYTIPQMFEELQSGEIFFIPAMYYSEERKSIMSYTEPYFYNDFTILGNEKSQYVKSINDLSGQKIAISKDFWQAKYIESIVPEVTIVDAKNMRQAITLVMKGEADYTVENLLILNHLIKKVKGNNFVLSGKMDVRVGSHFGVSKHYPELINILNKAIRKINYNQIIEQQEILSTNNRKHDYITSIMILIAGTVVIATSLAIVIKYMTNIKQEQEQELIEKQNNYENILYHLVETLEEASILNDVETGTHTKRVSYFCEYLARECGLDKDIVKEIKQYSTLHDIGKIGVPSQILRKPAKLTNEEFAIIKEHVIIGSELIDRLAISPIAKNIIAYHHENYDGSGYASGLKGEEIPIEARIMAIADVYDALRMKRVYKDSMTHEEAVKIIISESGKKFDPSLVEIFEKNHMIFSFIFDYNSKEQEKSTND